MKKSTRCRAALRWGTPLAVSVALAGSCIVDDDRCSDNQVLDTQQRTGCVCAPGAVTDPRGYGCMKCGEHEQAVADKCECESGYIRPAEGAPCEVNMGSSQGDPCSAEAPCSAPYPYCATLDGESYCTDQGCTTQDACPINWRCKQADGMGFCAKPPTGLGLPCTMQSDCEGQGASYCESFVSHVCLVQSCATRENICQSRNSCCDLPALLGTSLCVPSTRLMNGLCPDGQPPVPQ
jgi:hypothetical protein